MPAKVKYPCRMRDSFWLMGLNLAYVTVASEERQKEESKIDETGKAKSSNRLRGPEPKMGGLFVSIASLLVATLLRKGSFSNF